MWNKIKFMKLHTTAISVVLAALLPVLAKSSDIAPTTIAAHQSAFCQLAFKEKQEAPLLSIKSSATDGSNIVFTYNISLLSDTVLTVLNNIKNSHKPGASVAFEFYLFEVDTDAKTLKVGMGNGIITQQKLMEYLQKRLEASL